MNFSIKDFSTKLTLWIWSHALKKSLMEYFIIRAVMLAQLQHVLLISPNGALTFWTSQGRKNITLWLDAAELTYPDQK